MKEEMNLQHLKWTKSINPKDGRLWAYDDFSISHLLKLAWKKGDDINASKPEREDLILLRQKGYVTHLVKVLDYKPEHESGDSVFNLYRIVEVLWVVDWSKLPESAKADEVFGYLLHLEGGKVMHLESMPTFQDYWSGRGGLAAFHQQVDVALNLAQGLLPS